MCELLNRRNFLAMVSGDPIRPPRSAASCASGFSRFHLLYSSHMLTVPGAGRWRFFEAPQKRNAKWKNVAPSGRPLASSSVLAPLKNDTTPPFALISSAEDFLTRLAVAF